MTAFPLGSARVANTSIPAALAEGQSGGVWLLEDARRANGEAALAIAERLGVEFRRVPLCWSMGGLLARVSRRGSLGGLTSVLPLAQGGPALTLSTGARAAAVASWLKRACGSQMVTYGACGTHASAADLRITDDDSGAGQDAHALSLLAAPHRLSALDLRAAGCFWRERLDHLPHPRLALILGTGPFGAEVQPSEAYRLASGLSAAVQQANGAILAAAHPRAGTEATEAFAAGLADCLHLLHRGGEPGPDPTLGFLAAADAAVIAANARDRLLQACALPMPVYIGQAGPDAPGQARLRERLVESGHVRILNNTIGGWTRKPLDEAARAATAIRARLLL